MRGHDPRSLISKLSLPQLGSEVRPLPLGELGGFEGQVQLALFNGGPWGLWNVRSTSPTDLIGDVEFRRFSLFNHFFSLVVKSKSSLNDACMCNIKERECVCVSH